MPTCQNCGYELVLLSSRLKYKCALCSKLYPQKEVETKAFREWNKKQRENDLHNLELEKKVKLKSLREWDILTGFRAIFGDKKYVSKIKLTSEERNIIRGFRLLFKLSSEEKRRKKYLSTKRWEKKNPEKVKASKRRQWERHREEINAYMQKWRMIKQYESRLKQRLTFWRGKQRDLTLQFIKNEPHKLSTKEIEKLLPTWALTQLLFKKLDL